VKTSYFHPKKLLFPKFLCFFDVDVFLMLGGRIKPSCGPVFEVSDVGDCDYRFRLGYVFKSFYANNFLCKSFLCKSFNAKAFYAKAFYAKVLMQKLFMQKFFMQKLIKSN
jgi:hypothetical protein